MSAQAMLLGSGIPLITVDAADFDGTNDYMLRSAELSGVADGKSGVVSFWIRLDGGDGSAFRLLSNGVAAFERFHVDRTVSNIFTVSGYDAGGEIMRISTSAAYVASATWLHILSSWDLASNVSSIYVNDVSDQVVTTRTNATISYIGASKFAIGASAYAPASFRLNGCLAELYFAPNQYLDFSIEANRRKFISAAGKPVHLGVDGSLPTGTAPAIYLHLDNGEAVANFATNHGSGGNFTITGTLDTASTSPSD